MLNKVEFLTQEKKVENNEEKKPINTIEKKKPKKKSINKLDLKSNTLYIK